MKKEESFSNEDIKMINEEIDKTLIDVNDCFDLYAYEQCLKTALKILLDGIWIIKSGGKPSSLENIKNIMRRRIRIDRLLVF